MSWAAYTVPLRWVDLDAQGHVNNALLVDYLQEARVCLLLDGPNAHLLGRGHVVVRHQVEYLRPAEFSRTPVAVHVGVADVKAARFDYGYEILQDDIPVVRARTQACLVEVATGAPRRLSAAERAHFESLATPVAPLRDLGRWQVGRDAHEHSFNVRWSDLDPNGHVNNVRFFDYVAEARIHMSSDADPAAIRTAATADAEYLWLVVRRDVEYLLQLEHRVDPYLVRTGLAKAGTTSLTFVAEIVDPSDGRVFARSLTVVVVAGRDGRPVAVPGRLRDSVTQWQAIRLG